MTEKPQEHLGVLRAVFESIRGREISFFPRVLNDAGRLIPLADASAIAEIAEELRQLSETDKNKLADALKLARQSLDEVTAQTEYQDGKATRLLTILTFMSAFSGLLFSRLADGYPISQLGWGTAGSIAASTLIVSSYLCFAFFAICAISGALVTFHAIRARFRYPKEPASHGRVSSLLFYLPISRTHPQKWARSFKDSETDSICVDLEIEYFKNYIIESYLVAAKVADKMRFLEPAQRLQSWAITALLGWLFMIAAIFAIVSPEKKGDTPSIRAIVTPTSSACIIGGTDVPPLSSIGKCGAAK